MNEAILGSGVLLLVVALGVALAARGLAFRLLKTGVVLGAVIGVAGAFLMTLNLVAGAVLVAAGLVVAAIAGAADAIVEHLKAREKAADEAADHVASDRAFALDRLEAIEAELAALNGRRRKAQAMPAGPARS